ncbi:GNAT family N-acetyltransferase [Curtobacterium sp. ME26]|uniref:GNAT family N-acetyltransferase n=1 Tax=Curtobacterium sp. ME26 TaxID=2744254 RepID=UPI0015F3792C|nr:GNAT family N-acetyltransferase [Curtobacterium sp. ME26]
MLTIETGGGRGRPGAPRRVVRRPDKHGRGVGRQLVSAVERACAELGIEVVRLDTRGELAEACALYERLGYRRVGPFNAEPYSDRWYAKQVDR